MNKESLPEVLFPDTPENVPTVKYEDGGTSPEMVEQQARDRGELEADTLRKSTIPPEEAYPGEQTLRDRES